MDLCTFEAGVLIGGPLGLPDSFYSFVAVWKALESTKNRRRFYWLSMYPPPLITTFSRRFAKAESKMNQLSVSTKLA